MEFLNLLKVLKSVDAGSSFQTLTIRFCVVISWFHHTLLETLASSTGANPIQDSRAGIESSPW